MVCAFFYHCNNVSAFPHHKDVVVAVLSHLYHRLIQAQTRERFRAAWDHVLVNIHHGPTPFVIPHAVYESTHSQYVAPYQTQKPEFLAKDRL